MDSMLSFLTKDLVDKAVLEIDKNGIPKNRQGTGYAILINNQEYPFKLLITEAAILAKVNVTSNDFSSTDKNREGFEKLIGYPVVNLNHKMEYFDLAQLHNYKNDIGQPYDSKNQSTKLYFDTRKKLQYLGEQLSKKLGINIINNYDEKPNKMAGQGKGFVLKEYILTGFLPNKYSDLGKDVFIKITFYGFKSNFNFGLDIDVNFSNEKNKFNRFREKFQEDANWKIPVDNTFPKNWNDLIDITLPIFKTQIGYLDDFFSNNKEMSELNNYIKILKHKKQIILQGPPGTGKTYTAKKIAQQLVGTSETTSFNILTPALIKSTLKVGQTIANASGTKDYYTIIKVHKDKVELKSDRSEVWDPSFNNIITKYNELVNGILPSNKNAKEPYEVAVAKHLFEIIKPSDSNKVSNYTLVQFHPSYTYEDFVRGISAKSEGEHISYETENKILASLAQEANNNLIASRKDVDDYSKERGIKDLLIQFSETVQDKIDENEEYKITEAVSIVAVEIDAFRYTGKWKTSQRMKFNDLVTAVLENVSSRQDFKKLENVSGLAKQHATYFFNVLEKFEKEFKQQLKNAFNSTLVKPELKNYVLIIDEINRANLPSVLGELIYALEYRGKEVNSMYAIDGDNKISIPENLFIIGTMNTADRSVGHIDYAIKRRFAFVDMLPNVEVITNDKAKVLFNKVSELFTDDYLASDFDAKDVHLGHSYFLLDEKNELSESEQLKLKLDYEILPILNEYVKDGLLLETSEDKIKEISGFEC
ncbi:AAA family ATPase [Gelidibacter mesophilus]|uniref:AAA family ATPase n=1 Tax=Gelidibacter mesophilus TaxID=169050 RepID=UPI000685D763|nr:AAA family ATPase [Gelidibacter mesophilus]